MLRGSSLPFVEIVEFIPLHTEGVVAKFLLYNKLIASQMLAEGCEAGIISKMSRYKRYRITHQISMLGWNRLSNLVFHVISNDSVGFRISAQWTGFRYAQHNASLARVTATYERLFPALFIGIVSAPRKTTTENSNPFAE